MLLYDEYEIRKEITSMKKLIRNYIDLLLTFYADHFTHYSYNY